VLVIVAQFGLVLPPVPAGILSLVTEIFGLLMVGALIFFLVRQSPLQENMAVMNTFMDTFINKKLPIFLLLFIGLTGFLAEGSRLSIEHSAFSLISPVGCFFSLISPDAPIFLQMMIRIHLMAVLIFLALIPYTFMRHIPAGVQKVLYRDNTLPGQLNPAELDLKPVGAQTALDLSTKGLLDAQACAECGRCEEQCPAFISGKPLSPRKVMQHIYSQAMGPQKAASSQKKGSASLLCDGVGSDEIWSCTTCMACIEHCPVYIRPMDSIMEMRRHLVLDRAAVPKEALSMIRDLEVFEDVSGKGPALKKAWAQAQRIPLLKDLDEKPEVLLWAGCSGMFHPRYADVTLAMAKILTAAGIRFAVLGHGEACCGEPARRLGEEALFNTLAQKNNQALNASGVDTIIVLCPHCFNTLKNEYIIFDQQYEVVPAVSHLLELIEAQKIVPQYPIDKTMALHDPCYLGRANRIFEPLRDLMQALPGITLKELDRSRDKALCCGGGGARMWLHESLGENISTVRARDIDDSRVDTVGTACPFCMTMLQDATVSLSGENAPDVMDIIELTARSIGVENKEIQ
jgi:Fe-S oxidoreductase